MGHAQTITTLVSNTGQGSTGTTAHSGQIAQTFRTGSNAAGYTLSSVEIFASDTTAFSLDVYTAHANGSPDTLHASLTAPASFAAGALTFTAPADTILDANTTYVLHLPAQANFTIANTESDNEDSGGAANWSIGNSMLTLSGCGWTCSSTTKSLRIAIKGSANTYSVLLSNDGQTQGGTDNIGAGNYDWVAQTFTTGSFGAGYELDAVALKSADALATLPAITVTLRASPGRRSGRHGAGDLHESVGVDRRTQCLHPGVVRVVGARYGLLYLRGESLLRHRHG